MGQRDFSRAERVADQIQREVADLLAREVSDPRIGDVTVSGVDVSRDLRNARVFITTPAGADVQRTMGALARATGFVRGQLARRLRLRYLPRLEFVHDATLDEALRVDALIDAALRDGAGSGAADGEGETD